MKKSDWIFILLFLLFSVIYYHDFLNAPPQNVHIWRQTDCLSMAKHYEEGSSFMEPEMHEQYGDHFASGKSAGEFPVLYYVVGKFWRLFGFSYWSYRIFYLLILFFGLFSLYKGLQLLLQNNFWAITLPLLFFTSPVYAYYGVSFLTDIPAINFVLIALYFFLRYRLHSFRRFFWLSMLFFALAGLVKISSLVIFIFLGAILVLESFTKIKSLESKKLFQHLKIEWIGFSLVLLVIFLWYYYASVYNSIHGFKYTFNAIHPIWKMEDNTGEQVVSGIKNFTSMVFFSRPMLWLLFLLGIFNLINLKEQSLFAWLANLLISIGVGVYIVFWFPLLGVHDYYWGAMLVIFLSVLIPFIYFVKVKGEEIFNNFKVKILFSIFLLVNFIYCSSLMSLKKFSTEGFYPMVGNHNTVELLRWFNHNHQTKVMRYERIKGYFEEIGISREDKIIVMNDDSFNSSLFLADRKGWTGFMPLTDELIRDYIANGAKYILIDNPESLKANFLAKYIQNPVGDFEGVQIFSLEGLGERNSE